LQYVNTKEQSTWVTTLYRLILLLSVHDDVDEGDGSYAVEMRRICAVGKVMVGTLARGQQPLAALGKLTIAMLIGVAIGYIYIDAVLLGQFYFVELAIAALALICAGIIAVGWRWAPLLGALLCLWQLITSIGIFVYDLTHPEDFHFFAFNVILLPVLIIGILSGIGATVQNYRGAERRTPRWLGPGLVALATFCLGTIVTATIPREGSNIGINEETLSALPQLSSPGLHFDQPELRAKVGEVVALRLENPDDEAHSLDIDEFNVHVPMPMDQSTVAMFKPTRAGTFTFHCAVPGHAEAGMIGKLIVGP
jgi:plastocyanin